MTRTAWADCVEWSQATADRKAILQDEEGRLWDVVYGHAGRALGTSYRLPAMTAKELGILCRLLEFPVLQDASNAGGGLLQ